MEHGARLEYDARSAEDSAIEGRVRAKRSASIHLPKDIRSLGSAREEYLYARFEISCGSDGEIAGYLEYPYVVDSARKGDIRWYEDIRAPLVETRSDCETADIAAAELGSGRTRPAGSICIGCLHIAHSGSQERGIRHLTSGS